ncbi:MAG: metallophosphoesterase [Candidatus Woesearchaeota archaeon]
MSEAIEISRNAFAVKLSIYLKEHKTLILSDFHIGLEEALQKQGFLIPRFQLKSIIDNLNKTFEILEKKKLEVERIIINGDLKHEFGTISEQEWKDTLKVIDFLKEKTKDLVLIKGNHDTILGPIASKKSISLVEYLILNDTLIAHGDKIIREANSSKISRIIIGHEHPAISLRDGLRVEKFKTFLIGKWNKKELIVMPSFCFVTEGTDILREELLSPFLREANIKKFRVVISEKELYNFGTVEKILDATD